MSNDIIDLKNLPPEMAALFGATPDAPDLAAGASAGFPSISIKGSRFHVKQSGDMHTLLTPEGHPSPFANVVIITGRSGLSKTYYASQYVEGADDEPDCYSIGGEFPSPDAPHPQAISCAVCPHSQWGSKITDEGKKAKACQDYRRVVVMLLDPVPQTVDNTTPMLLRVPAASLGELAAYDKKVKGAGINVRAVVTQLSFDTTVSYPKLQFKAVRPISLDIAERVVELLKDDTTQLIMGEDETGPSQVKSNVQTPQPEYQQPPAPAPEPEAPAAPAQADTAGGLFEEEPPAPKPAAKKKTAKKKVAKKAAKKAAEPQPAAEPDDEAKVAHLKVAPDPSPNAPATPSDDDLADLLGDLESGVLDT